MCNALTGTKTMQLQVMLSTFFQSIIRRIKNLTQDIRYQWYDIIWGRICVLNPIFEKNSYNHFYAFETASIILFSCPSCYEFLKLVQLPNVHILDISEPFIIELKHHTLHFGLVRYFNGFETSRMLTCAFI